MIVVIDGYNLLKQLIKSDFATEKQRQNFISYIAAYAQSKNHYVILVFDGNSFSNVYYKNPKYIKIVYSGYKQNADDYIKQYIQEHLKANMLIVSSDRGVYSFASRHGIATVDALTFYELTRQKKPLALRLEKTNGSAQKLHNIESEYQDSPELDALMQQASKVIMHKQELSDNAIKASGKKLSKHDRKMFKIIKKL